MSGDPVEEIYKIIPGEGLTPIPFIHTPTLMRVGKYLAGHCTNPDHWAVHLPRSQCQICVDDLMDSASKGEMPTT